MLGRQELVIGGYTEPGGQRVGFGALLLGYYEDGDLRYAGKVGTGFDTRFYVAVAPEDHAASADGSATYVLSWVQPAEALARHAAGDFPLEFATRQILESLLPFATIGVLMSHARTRRRIGPVHPRVTVTGNGERRILLPGDAAYAEVMRIDPVGSGTASRTIVPERTVMLAETVRRITAPNPGLMTGPGTNTYILGRGGNLLRTESPPSRAREALRPRVHSAVCVILHSSRPLYVFFPRAPTKRKRPSNCPALVH